MLYAQNVQEISARGIVWPTICIICAAWISKRILTGLFRLDNERAAVLVSFLVMIFFCYGHFLNAFTAILNTLGVIEFGGIRLTRWPYAWPVWVIFALAVGIWLLRMKPSSVQRMTKPLNATSAFLVATNVAVIAFDLIGGSGVLRAPQTVAAITQGGSEASATVTQGIGNKHDLPDVYHIYLDGYGSEETLKRVYGFDNTSFYDFLNRKGFYLAKESHSNYVHTILSIPSTLNMTYLDFLAKPGGRRDEDERRLQLMRQDNKEFHFFRSAGYAVYVIAAEGFSRLQPQSVGSQPSLFRRVETCGEDSSTRFLSVMMENSALCHWQWNLFAPVIRDRHRCLLAKLAESARMPGPKFVYFHILLPHPPFVFGSNGESRAGHVLEFDGYVWEDREGYINQVKFINQEITGILEEILKNGPPNPIIVLQGDHGPQSYGMADYVALKPAALKERTGILNAYLVPDHVKTKLYPSITPVNSFRLILKHCFNADCGLLEDKTYAYWLGWFEKYIDITDMCTATTKQ